MTRSVSDKSLPYRFSWWEKIVLFILPPVAAWLLRLWCGSCRIVHLEGKESEEEALQKSGRRAVWVGWHQRMFYFFYYFGPLHVTMMISKSKDGEYAARLAQSLGFKAVRGSSTRGGAEALHELIRRVREEGDSAGMMLDGPKGPARVVKMGTLVIARDSGIPIIPMMYSADRVWQLRSWDKYVLPKPFAKLIVLHDKPIWIPKDTSDEDLEKYRKLLEDRVNEMLVRADTYFGVSY